MWVRWGGRPHAGWKRTDASRIDDNERVRPLLGSFDLTKELFRSGSEIRRKNCTPLAVLNAPSVQNVSPRLRPRPPSESDLSEKQLELLNERNRLWHVPKLHVGEQIETRPQFRHVVLVGPRAETHEIIDAPGEPGGRRQALVADVEDQLDGDAT